jgi:class 3 adenylate cyclase
MLGLHRLSIQSKMILLLLGVSLVSILVVSWIGYWSGREALLESVRTKLQGVQVAKSTTLKTMLESLRDQVVAMSDSKVVIEGTTAFREAYRELGSAELGAEESARLDAFYRDDFIHRLDENVDGTPIVEQYLPRRPAERYLQYHYLVANPNEYEKKQAMAQAAGDPSRYGTIHAGLHPFFERAVGIFGFEDMMLVDVETMDIVYSYQKTAEFGTNLVEGPYATSRLGEKARAMRMENDRDNFKIADFEPYRPTLGRPMGFAMSPVFAGSKITGLLVLQFPIDNFNRVLTGGFNWEAEGMGSTGQTYLVGPDGTMRSQSRPFHTDPESFLRDLRRSEVPSAVVDRIAAQREVICVLPVGNESVSLALQGERGIHEVENPFGKRVLSAYGPIELDSLRWAVLSEMDLAEAMAPVRAFGRHVLVVACGLALAVTVLALVAANLLTRPLRHLAEGARRIGSGDTDVRVELQSKDEFGELARVFNEMSASIMAQKHRLEKQVRENEELLHGILPASAVALRLGGDERASREFADVTVLFAEILGMEEFGIRSGEPDALRLLGDLISAIDEAAEKSGIEKVKTTGASYLAVCGLSVHRPDHARRVVQFAQEMGRIVAIFNRDEDAGLALAAGIHCGPVVGGVIGRRKFLYDLWGETVAIARKLGSSGGSAIRVTNAVRDRLGESFIFRGPNTVSEPGAAEVWEVAIG